jgi:uncharacterized membrane protein YidH (DUF202 family)
METIEHASHLVMGFGGILIVAGIIQMFLATISIQRRHGRIRSRFKLQKPSSIYLGVILILIGALLLFGYPFLHPSDEEIASNDGCGGMAATLTV